MTSWWHHNDIFKVSFWNLDSAFYKIWPNKVRFESCDETFKRFCERTEKHAKLFTRSDCAYRRYEMNCTSRDNSNIDMPICLAEIPYSGKSKSYFFTFFIQCIKIYKRCYRRLKMDSDIKKNQFLKSMERFRCVMGSTNLNAGIFESTII